MILEINGTELCGLSHTEAAKLIADTFKNLKSESCMKLLVTDSSVSVINSIDASIYGLNAVK